MVNANALHLPLADNCVQCVVTSPPYFNLRDYEIEGQIGLERTPEEYISKMVNVFREVWRVLKDDGIVWLNVGDSYNGSGKGGNPDNSCKQGTNVGTVKNKGRLTNIESLKPKDLIGIPWMLAFALRNDGWYLRSDIIWAKQNCMPESVKDRPTKSHEYLFLLSKSNKYYYNAEAIKTPTKGYEHDKRARVGRKRYPTEKVNGIRKEGFYPMANARSVWWLPTEPSAFAHYAVMPQALVEPCILAGSRPGDIVLDPFSGSGTVERVAIKHGRRSIGIELNFGYIKNIAKKRVANVQLHFVEATL